MPTVAFLYAIIQTTLGAPEYSLSCRQLSMSALKSLTGDPVSISIPVADFSFWACYLGRCLDHPKALGVAAAVASLAQPFATADCSSGMTARYCQAARLTALLAALPQPGISKTLPAPVTPKAEMQPASLTEYEPYLPVAVPCAVPNSSGAAPQPAVPKPEPAQPVPSQPQQESQPGYPSAQPLKVEQVVSAAAPNAQLPPLHPDAGALSPVTPDDSVPGPEDAVTQAGPAAPARTQAPDTSAVLASSEPGCSDQTRVEALQSQSVLEEAKQQADPQLPPRIPHSDGKGLVHGYKRFRAGWKVEVIVKVRNWHSSN